MNLPDDPMESAGRPRVSAVIVSYRVPELLRQCLQSLQIALDSTGAEIWVVDNASEDSSVGMVREHFPSVRIVPNRENRGFAAANNQVLAVARGEFLLLLNPDTLVDSQAVRLLLEFLDAHPEAGMVGPRLLGGDGSRQTSVRRFPSVAATLAWLSGIGRNRHPPPPALERPSAVPWLSGAALLVRGRAIQEVGLLDENFFMYGEDVDWCKRFWEQGWEVWHQPEAVITHLGGRSAARLDSLTSSELWLEQTGRNEYLYFRKHHGRLAASLIRAASLLFSSLASARWSWSAFWSGDQAARRRASMYARKAVESWRGWGFEGVGRGA